MPVTTWRFTSAARPIWTGCQPGTLRRRRRLPVKSTADAAQLPTREDTETMRGRNHATRLITDDNMGVEWRKVE